MKNLQGQPEYNNYADMFLICNKVVVLTSFLNLQSSRFLIYSSTVRRYDTCWNGIQFKTSASEGFIKDTKKKDTQKPRQQFKKRK